RKVCTLECSRIKQEARRSPSPACFLTLPGASETHHHQIPTAIIIGRDGDRIRNRAICLVYQLHIECPVGGKRRRPQYKLKSRGAIFLIDPAYRLLFDRSSI